MYIVMGLTLDGYKFPALVSEDKKIRVYTSVQDAVNVAKDLHNIYPQVVYFAKNISE